MDWGGSKEKNYFSEKLCEWWSHLLKWFKIREKETWRERENQGLQFGHTDLETLAHRLSAGVKEAAGCMSPVLTGEAGAGQRAVSTRVALKVVVLSQITRECRWRMSKTKSWMRGRRREGERASNKG